jgi:hypothetical protein
MAAHEARAKPLASELVEKSPADTRSRFGITRPGLRHFEFRINGVHENIDVDRPDIAPRKFPALAGSPRPDRARAVLAFNDLDTSIKCKI